MKAEQRYDLAFDNACELVEMKSAGRRLAYLVDRMTQNYERGQIHARMWQQHWERLRKAGQ